MVINMGYDSTWGTRNPSGNITKQPNGVDINNTDWVNVTFKADEWTHFGLLYDRVPENFTRLLLSPIGENVTYWSSWVNNDTQDAYWDHIWNRTRNANRTLYAGNSIWAYASVDFSMINRTYGIFEI